jgi:hypothetical protein
MDVLLVYDGLQEGATFCYTNNTNSSESYVSTAQLTRHDAC